MIADDKPIRQQQPLKSAATPNYNGNVTSITNTSHYCQTCGYRLDHLGGDNCAECGQAFDLNNPNTFDINPSAYGRRRFWRLAFVPMVVCTAWACAILGPLSIFLFLIFPASIGWAFYRKRWIAAGIILLINPLVLFAARGVTDYIDGTGQLSGHGLPGGSYFNVDPELRLQRANGGCVISGNEWVRDAPHDGTLTALVRVFGPIKGAYTGPYPDQAQAIAAIQQATPITVAQLNNDQVTINGQTITLGTGIGGQLISRSDWSYLTGQALVNYQQQHGPITATLYQGQCLIIRIPRPEHDYHLSGSAQIALIDAVTGRPFAQYAQGDFNDYPTVTWMW